jgi:hypothetical protein
MFKKLKSNLLTYLFRDWVESETDVETLHLTLGMIKKRENILVEDVNTSRTIIKGFRAYNR